MPDFAADLAAILHQEATLTFPSFDFDTAWQLGTTLRGLALARGVGIVVDIRRFGSPHQQLFYTALPGTSPDSARWVQRKVNVVARFHRSSYQLGRYLGQNKISFADRYDLPAADYATHGGCFPITVEGTGIIGAVTVSGLPQREDHNLVVEAICLVTKRNYDDFRLPPEA